MQTDLLELRSYLEKEYKTRLKLNSSYSKRAFARDLGLSPTSLNDFLLGKRNLGLKNIDKIFKYLKKKSSINCSWCGKHKSEIKTMIAGPTRLFICNNCVDKCNQILKGNLKARPYAKCNC